MSAMFKLIARVPPIIYNELTARVACGTGGKIGEYIRRAVANQLEADRDGDAIEIPAFLPVRPGNTAQAGRTRDPQPSSRPCNTSSSRASQAR